MAYYNTCPRCGSNLDPQEKCDCETREVEQQQFFKKYLKVEPETKQFVLNLKNINAHV